MGGLFKRGGNAAPAFTGSDRKSVVNPLIQDVQSLPFDPSRVSGAFGSPFDGSLLEARAAQSLLGFNPESVAQGGLGFLGQSAGLFSNAAGNIGSDPLGATDFFQRALDPNFTDPTQNQNVQNVLGAIQNQAQRAFNVGADQVASSAARASGGVGQGSAQTNALSRLSSDISSRVADQSANVLLGEQQRLRGIQQAAAQQALGEGIRRSQALASVGQGLGQLGLSQAGIGLEAAGGLADLGQRFSSRELAGALFPLQQQFALAQLLKSGQVIQQPSFFDNLTGAAKEGGNLLSGIAAARGG